MAVNSAQEIHDLITTLGRQFHNEHADTARQLHTLANLHIDHVVSEGAHFVPNEIHKIVEDWQRHRTNIQDAEDWFVANGPHLITIGEKILAALTEAL